MVAWFVAVGVLTDEPCDVWLHPSGGLRWGFKHGVKPLQKGRVPSMHSDLSLHIVGRGKVVLPGVGFSEVEVYFKWVKTFYPSTLPFWLIEFACRMNEVFPMFGPPGKTAGEAALSKVTGHPCDAGIVVSVFQGFGHALMLVVGRDEPKIRIGVESQVHGVCRLHHRLQGEFLVPVVHAP